MGKVDDSSTFSDNDWEEVNWKSDEKIKEWIDEQLKKRSCLVVLIGSKTSERKWVKYEIRRACELDKGIVGIYIHKLKDRNGYQDRKGNNPFDMSISKHIKCFDSMYSSSESVYHDISDNIENLIEYGIANKPSTW